MDHILVTGATGFTGKALCERLIRNGERVVAFARERGRAGDLQTMGVELREVDLKSRADIRKNFADIVTVYHLAAAYRTEHADQSEFDLVNVEGTRHLLEAARDNHVKRFIHCSTVGVQGDIEDPPANEEYRLKPGDHYQQSKTEGELLARKYFADGLPGTVIRPTGIYGPRDLRFLKLFRAIDRGYFIMIGDGKTLYHLTYIDDLVDGIVLAGQKPEALGEVFTIAGEQYTTIKHFVNVIADVLGKPHPKWHIPFFPVYLASLACDSLCRPLGISPPIYPRRVEFFHKDRAFTITKAKKLLGYRPKVGLREGLQRTAAWYRERGLI